MNSKIIMFALAVSSVTVFSADFKFNSGSSAGWTFRLADVGVGLMRSGTAGWADANDFPRVLTDPIGDSYGAAQVAVLADDYNAVPAGHTMVLQFVSPDLRASADWQAARSFSARLLPSFASDPFLPDITANLSIAVEDLDSGAIRSFAVGATSIPLTTWSYWGFDIQAALAAAAPPITHYKLSNVIANFRIAVASGRSVAEPLVFDVDNVLPRCGATTYTNETAFRAVAGFTTTYGFESHHLSGILTDLPPSPIPASDFAGNFNLAYANLDALNVSLSVGGSCNADGVRSLFTHSMVASDYSLTFSNFGGESYRITAFGLTVCDFASGISTPVRITYNTGTDADTLLAVPSGQPGYTHNFVGVVVCPENAFNSITLTFNDNLSGMQSFDKVIYSSGYSGGAFRIRPVEWLPNTRLPLLKWISSSEKWYDVLSSTNLKNWNLLATVPGVGPTTSYGDTNPFSPRKFYRIQESTNSNNGN